MAPRKKSASSSTTPTAPSANGTPFARRLVLFHWMLGQLGYRRFADLQDAMWNAPEGLTEDNVSRFHHTLVGHLKPEAQLDAIQLLTYDANIVRHTAAISGRRERPVQLKYFQYLALLFTEIYLDRWFTDPAKLLAELEAFRAAHNEDLAADDRIGSFQPEDLRKLAFWNATGSGKTLIMHINILQYRHWQETKGDKRRHKLNRIILITPNEGLTRQHLEEFRLSDMQAEAFRPKAPSLFRGKAIEIIEISKLREDQGIKTVAVDAFEANNLVLVDEGHRGGDIWRDMRKRLSAEGFSFEYSATFGQMVKAATGKAVHDLGNEYGKAILFDYSFKYFHEDGYGKAYRILNLADDSHKPDKTLYLTACLLAFHQQLQVWADKREALARFLISKPLWVFVGATVSAKPSKTTVADVVEILRFLASFVKERERERGIRDIARLLSGDTGLLDEDVRDVFCNAYPYLIVRTAEQVYQDVLQTVFNTARSGAFHVDELKGGSGEIALSVGTADPFGVINVGDAPALMKACRSHTDLLNLGDKPFTGSLFHGIEARNSPITMLIGSRKFSEGWSSWRVSTMGLMNMGRGEGPEIIQLFGRGVRLKGLDHSLKRHTGKGMHIRHDTALEMLETLNVFGIRADYMRQFRDYLKTEGVDEDDRPAEIILPVIVGDIAAKGLKVPSLRKGTDFKRDPKAPRPRLQSAPAAVPGVYLNWYPRLQAVLAQAAAVGAFTVEPHSAKLTAAHVALLDLDAIWLALQEFKAERSWFNMEIPRAALKDLLLNQDWYMLHIPPERMAFDHIGRVAEWQEIAVALLKLHCERVYDYRKGAYQDERMEVRALATSDPVFFDRYTVLVDKAHRTLIQQLEALRDAVGTFTGATYPFPGGSAHFYGSHLYNPLLHASGPVQIKPVALNTGERNFVEDIRRFEQAKPKILAGRQIHLLRNRTRGQGFGFFTEGGFYPDFILWIMEGTRQYVTFVDPHGLRHALGQEDHKIDLHLTIKATEARLGDPDMILNSFIVSTTAFADIPWKGRWTEEDFQNRNVVFRREGDLGHIKRLFERVLPLA
ncbi:MAG: DEAD/DEAH box helicase family protein [Rhodospirillaceae bacterium]|nr:DEAD/DEAH box helicase family protein [Rhodospirillales bacterium]